MQKQGKPPGRPSKNSTKTKITFNPSDEALKIYNGWEKKAETLDRAIVDYQNKNTDEINQIDVKAHPRKG